MIRKHKNLAKSTAQKAPEISKQPKRRTHHAKERLPGTSLNDELAEIFSEIVSILVYKPPYAAPTPIAEDSPWTDDDGDKPNYIPIASQPVHYPSSERTAVSASVEQQLQMLLAKHGGELAASDLNQGAFWALEALEITPGLAIDAAALLLKLTNIQKSGKSVLSFIGEFTSALARREILRRALVRRNWNLTHTSEDLHMGGPSGVLRAIKDLGLSDELDQARRNGLVTRAWNRGRSQSD